MNCRRFQREIYEYLDGSLSAGAQAAADEHLSACAACRQAVTRERQIALSLSERFQAAAGSLQLPAPVGRRVLAALADQRRPPGDEQDKVIFWRRWAWAPAIAALGLVLLVGILLSVRAPGPRVPRSKPRVAGDAFSAHFSYVVPIYTFRRQGGFVIDALTYQTNNVEEKFGSELTGLP